MPRSKSYKPKKNQKTTERQTSRQSDRRKEIVPRVEEPQQTNLSSSQITNQPHPKDSTNIRSWLTTNKIFFEIFAGTAFTVMAILLTWGQLNVSREQARYEKQQAAIDLAQASPQFVIFVEPPDAALNAASNDKIAIHNQGNRANKIRVHTTVFFKLVLRKDEEHSQEVAVPMAGYYLPAVYNGAFADPIFTIERNSNITKRGIIQSQLDQLAAADKVTITIVVERYVRLSYQDILNNSRIEYYLIPFQGQQVFLDQGEGEKVFATYENGGTEGTVFDFENVTAQDLYNLFP